MKKEEELQELVRSEHRPDRTVPGADAANLLHIRDFSVIPCTFV